MSYAPTMDSDLFKLMYTMLLQLIPKYIKKTLDNYVYLYNSDPANIHLYTASE